MMTMDHGTVRNLEQIQEEDRDTRTPRGVTLALLGLGGACVVFAFAALGGHRAAPVAPTDPLGALVAQQGKGAPQGSPGAKPVDLAPHDVTFPGILSDSDNPTTALAAVRGPTPSASALPPGIVPVPPPAADRLPVVPLPAQNVLEATPVVTRPRDALTKAANDSAHMATAAGPSAPAGHEGGYQLQVSSFRSQAEANTFADQLRARGHKAHVIEANVPGRGVWYRVRVGPFPTQQAAAQYRTQFEQKEHVVPFLVQPTGKEKG